MPVRTIDNRFARFRDHFRPPAADPERRPTGPEEPGEDERAIPPLRRPFDDWPFDFDPIEEGSAA